jgi:hypothetical protein
MAFGATLSEVGRKNEIPCSDEGKSEACGAKSATRDPIGLVAVVGNWL